MYAVTVPCIRCTDNATIADEEMKGTKFSLILYTTAIVRLMSESYKSFAHTCCVVMVVSDLTMSKGQFQTKLDALHSQRFDALSQQGGMPDARKPLAAGEIEHLACRAP